MASTGRSMRKRRRVGFVMISDKVGSPDYIAHYLWKLLINERYQRRGFGTATLDLIVEYFRNRGVGTMWTCAGQGEGNRSRSTSDTASNEPEGSTATEILLLLEISSTSPADEPTSLQLSVSALAWASLRECPPTAVEGVETICEAFNACHTV
jgi:Acetyltransferase (GNAT) family